MRNQRAEYVRHGIGPQVLFSSLTLEAETAKAVKAKFPDPNDDKGEDEDGWLWVPKSQILVQSEDSLQVTKWWADKVGLEYDESMVVQP